MSVVKEYAEGETRIKIHDDYISQEYKETKEMLISIVIDYLKNKNI